MYKSVLFTIVAVFTFLVLCTVVYFQYEEMKEYGMLYDIMQEHP